MAQDSAFQQGSTTGHALSTDVWSAPYSADEFSDVWSKLLGSNYAGGYVVPDYGNDLNVQANSPVALNVIVKSGAAFIRGRIYENTADETVTLSAADATNPRLDRIVLRYDSTLLTIVLAAVTGTPAATPSLPALTQTASTYEVSLAYVWVAATATTIANTEIHDERLFAANFNSVLSGMMQRNLLSNSEFMAISSTGASTYPDRWEDVAGILAPTLATATRPAQMSRGRAVRMTAGAASRGISQRIQVKASTTYVIKGLVQVTAGDVGAIQVTTNSASPGTIIRNIRRTGAWVEHLIYYTTEADATLLTLSVYCVNNADVVDVGQFLIVEGYIPGPFREISEIIQYDSALTDASYSATAKSTASAAADLTASFESTIMTGTKAVLVYIMAKDSGSSASTAELGIRNNITSSEDVLRLYLRGVPNDINRSQQGWVNLGTLVVTTTPTLLIDMVATGAGTLDVTITILGIMI